MIYIVEDDNSIRDLMVYTLNASGYSACGFENANAFWAALDKGRPELILLDIMLPEEDGISVLRKLKANPATAGIPVIMETAKGQEYDKVIGLDLGADDYMTKPFGMMEMVARIKAVLRRTDPENAPKAIEIGPILLQPTRHLVSVSGENISLTLKEYDLLYLFMSNPEIVFTREQLLQKIWSTDYMGESRTVDVHIGTLRTKLGIAGNLIETIRGVGYRLDPPAK